MHWHKFCKALQNRPDLLDEAFQMSYARAEALQREEGFFSFAQMVAKAKLGSIAPPVDWAPVDAVIRRAQKPAIFRLWRQPAPRGLAIAGLCVLLLAGFLAFSPPGKALAAYIEKIFIQVVADGFQFTPSSYEEGVAQTMDGPLVNTVTDYPDLDAVEEECSRQLLRLEGDMFLLEGVTLYDNTLSGILLVATYKTPEGRTVYLQQQWRQTASAKAGLNPEDVVWEETLWDGTTLYCLVTSDHILNMLGAWRDEIVFIYADDAIAAKDIVAAVTVKE